MTSDGGVSSQVLPAWSHRLPDQQSPLRDITVGDLLREVAEAHPDRLALVAGLDPVPRRRWTYAELWDDARRVAAALGERFRVGERVAITAPNAPEWVLLQLGAALAGLTLVPLNTSYAPAELSFVLQQSRAVGVFVGSEAAAAQVAQFRSSLPALREVLPFDPARPFWASESPSADLPVVDPAAAALIQYTSGTTGAPKGAVLSHRQVVNNAILSGQRLELGPDDRWLNPLPMYHVNGTVFFALGAISAASCHILGKFDPELLLDLVETERATFLTGVPTLFVALAERPDLPDRDLSSLSLVTTGGTTVPAALVEQVRQAFEADVVVIYGQTEAGGVITSTLRGDAPAETARSVGLPLPHTEVVVADAATGHAVPVGEVGEIRVRGGTVIREYFGLPEGSGSALDADGWLHTGDLGCMEAEGRLQITGRLKELIIRGGENIYPRDIEEVLAGHADVSEVAVIGVPDDYYGETVGAVLRLRDGRACTVDELRTFVASKVSRRKVPAHWYVVPALPRTASGKVQKFVLREQAARCELQELR